MNRMHRGLMALGLCVIPLILLAGTDRSQCERCGCACAPQKVCQLVCETKKVPKTTYSYQCEDFCVPGPSERVKCAENADGTPCGPDAEHQKRGWLWFPKCAELKTRTKLVKTVTEQEKVTQKWVVEYLCPTCQTDAKP